MDSIRRFLWSALLWAMLPVTFVSGLPRMGCICANGDYKLSCDGHRGNCCQHEAPESHAHCCCGRAHRSSSAQSSPTKSDAGGDCCRRSARHQKGIAPSKRCCTPIVLSSVLSKGAHPVSIPNLEAHPWLISSNDFWRSPVSSPISMSMRSHHLPVPDLVIAHQVLLI